MYIFCVVFGPFPSYTFIFLRFSGPLLWILFVLTAQHTCTCLPKGNQRLISGGGGVVWSTPFFFGGLFFHFFSRIWRFLPKASRMSYHTTINGNQRELKSQNPFYWIGVTPHVPVAAQHVGHVLRAAVAVQRVVPALCVVAAAQHVGHVRRAAAAV
jgi:hypothetical protein